MYVLGVVLYFPGTKSYIRHLPYHTQLAKLSSDQKPSRSTSQLGKAFSFHFWNISRKTNVHRQAGRPFDRHKGKDIQLKYTKYLRRACQIKYRYMIRSYFELWSIMYRTTPIYYMIFLGWRISTDTGCAGCRRVEERFDVKNTHTHYAVPTRQQQQTKRKPTPGRDSQIPRHPEPATRTMWSMVIMHTHRYTSPRNSGRTILYIRHIKAFYNFCLLNN